MIAVRCLTANALRNTVFPFQKKHQSNYTLLSPFWKKNGQNEEKRKERVLQLKEGDDRSLLRKSAE